MPAWRLSVGGGSRLAEQMAASAWGDFSSTYLSLLHGLDPTPVNEIDSMRAGVSGSEETFLVNGLFERQEILWAPPAER